MKDAILYALLVVVVIAIILGIRAFFFVFAMVFHYGLIALVAAGLIFLFIKFYPRSNDKNQNP